MKILHLILLITISLILFACLNREERTNINKNKSKVFSSEPKDSASYKSLKYSFYVKDGRIYERKLVFAREQSDTICNCEFVVFYENEMSIYQGDSIFRKPLDSIIDIESFVEIDSCSFSKDKNRVYFSYATSDGGNRIIVDKADPNTFKSLCQDRWGIDKDHVFYGSEILTGLNLKKMKLLYPDSNISNYFVEYVKDDKHVFYENEIVIGADPKTFVVVNEKYWDSKDKYRKYNLGKKIE